MAKYLRINGYFKLPDNCDLEGLKDYEYLRKAANELKKATANDPPKDLTLMEKIKLFFEKYLWNLSDNFQWKRYWIMRDEGKYNHTYYMTVGERGGEFFHVGEEENE